MVGESKIVKLFEKFNEQGIKYCHWKSTDHLDASFLAETDFDLLVAKSDAFKFEVLLLEHGFIRARTPDLRTYPCVEDYIYYDAALGRWFHFHLHYQLPCGDRWVKSYHLPIESYILENRVFLDEYGIYNIDPLSEYLFFIVRMHMKWRFPLKKKSFIKENEFLRKRITATDDVLSTNPLFTPEVAAIYNTVHKGEYSVTRLSQRRLKKALKAYRRFSELKFSILNFFRYCYRLKVEFNRRILGDYTSGRRQIIHGGRIVAFVGMDGSGKSTMLLESESKFVKQIDVTKVFLGTGRSGAHFIRRCIFKLAEQLPLSKRNKTQSGDKQQIKKPSVQKLIWIYLCLKDRCVELKKLKHGIANGSLVLVDRWPQDCILDVADAMKLSSFDSESGLIGFVARKERKFYNELKNYSADLTIWFDIEPATSLQRKPNELDLDEAESYRKYLFYLSQNYYNNVLKVDAEQDYNIVSSNVNAQIWNLLSGK